MTRLARLSLSLLVLAVVMAVPARVAACSCMEQSLADAIRGADMAFVGTLTATDRPVPAAPQAGAREIVWSWDVERSRDALSTARIDLAAPPADGANCGVSFGLGERWLVVAHQFEGRLTSTSCSMNQLMDGSAPDVEEQVAAMLTVVPAEEPSEPDAQPSAPSLPVLLIVGAVALVAAVSALAFVRRQPS